MVTTNGTENMLEHADAGQSRGIQRDGPNQLARWVRAVLDSAAARAARRGPATSCAGPEGDNLPNTSGAANGAEKSYALSQ